MLKRLSYVMLALALAVVAIVGNASQATAAWPERPITMLIPFSPGGNTDTNGRIVAALLEKELGVQVRVVNRTGGSGVVGFTAMRDADPDGYTIGYAVSELTMLHWTGVTDITLADYTLLSQMTADAAAVHVSTASDYNSLSDLLDAIKANPGKLKTSGSGHGGPWHLATSGMLDSMGIDPDSIVWVPAQGCAPAMLDLAAGGIDFTACALVEAKALSDAGKVKTLAVIDGARNPSYPAIPTLKEAVGSDWALNDWGGVIAPKGLPSEVKAKYASALQKIFDSAQFQELLAKGGTLGVYRNSEDFEAYLKTMDANFGDIMMKVGIAK